jgi:hypothetical protein
MDVIQVIDCRKTVLVRYQVEDLPVFPSKLSALLAQHGHQSRPGEVSLPREQRRTVRGLVSKFNNHWQ